MSARRSSRVSRALAPVNPSLVRVVVALLRERSLHGIALGSGAVLEELEGIDALIGLRGFARSDASLGAFVAGRVGRPAAVACRIAMAWLGQTRGLAVALCTTVAVAVPVALRTAVAVAA